MSEHTGCEQQATYQIYGRMFNRNCFVSGISGIPVIILLAYKQNHEGA